MFKIDLSKELKKMTTSKGADPLKVEITPYHDWMILSAVFFVSLIVSFGFNIYMSIGINSDNFFTVSTKIVKGPELNKKGLENILTALAEKEAVFEKVRTEGVHVVDPSL